MSLSKLKICFLGLGLLAVVGCSGVKVSSQEYSTSMEPNTPVKDSACYDTSVLLGVGSPKAIEYAKMVLAAVDSHITSESTGLIQAQRNRHFGLFVGSGGEELSIAFKSIGDDKTFVTIATKTGFIGGAGQRAWSCEIVDQMVKLATKQ